MPYTVRNIRRNLAGDYPQVHPSALIDPSAQIIGNVHIGPNVFVGPLAVIRADERGPDGKVQPIVIEEEASVQDGAIIHSHGGTSVVIGPKSSLGHGAIVHGPSTIGAKCFLAMRCAVYCATLEDSVWIGMGAMVMRATLQSHLLVPAGAIINGRSDLIGLRFISPKEHEYVEHILRSSASLRNDYQELRKQMAQQAQQAGTRH